MSNFKHLSKSVPDMRSTFIISVEGILTKTKYEGEFTCKIPNIQTQASIKKYRAMLNGGLDASLDIETHNIHHMISYLKYTLEKAPEFWEESDNGYSLYDINVVEEVYKNVLKFEEEWIKTVWGSKKDDSKK